MQMNSRWKVNRGWGPEGCWAQELWPWGAECAPLLAGQAHRSRSSLNPIWSLLYVGSKDKQNKTLAHRYWEQNGGCQKQGVEGGRCVWRWYKLIFILYIIIIYILICIVIMSYIILNIYNIYIIQIRKILSFLRMNLQNGYRPPSLNVT